MNGLFLWTVVLFLSACSGPVTYTKLTSDNYLRRGHEDIEVYIDEKPTKEFKKIALISTNMWKENFATNIEWIKRKAADLGADAIILLRADAHASGGGLIAAPASGSFMALGASGESGYNYSAYAVKFIGNR